jgi:ubiquinol-cytochrome c reductase cytochrome b subunit
MSVVDADRVETTTAASPRPVRRFFPDLFAIEALVALAMLAVLIVLSVVTHASLEATASRDAAGYAPRPEWYFLWLFQMLKYFRGSLEPVGTVLVPLLLLALLLAAPFIDRRSARMRSLGGGTRPVRIVPRIVAALFLALLLTLTIAAAASEQRGPIPHPLPVPTWPPQSGAQVREAPPPQLPETTHVRAS